MAQTRRSLFVEWAKLHWLRDEKENAIAVLKDGLERNFTWLKEMSENTKEGGARKKFGK